MSEEKKKKDWQSYKNRAQYWLSVPFDDLCDCVENESRYKKLTSFDRICSNSVYMAQGNGPDTIKYLKLLLDRTEGRVAEKKEHSIRLGEPVHIALNVDGEDFGSDDEDEPEEDNEKEYSD